jgi:hypothetical protein
MLRILITTPRSIIRGWAIVLGVLALDVFQSIVLLLDNEKRRGASMLARALVDYDVRLRYYIVQALPAIEGFRKNSTIDVKHILDQMHAVEDWNNADASLLLGVVNGYDDEFISEKAKKGLEDLISRNENRLGRDFSSMHRFLLENEKRIRGVMPHAAGSLLLEYRNMKPNWHMQSAFLHGDQAILTDVTHYDDRGRDTPILWTSPIDGNRTIAFTAITHVIRILRSFSMILSFVPNLEILARRAAEVWFVTPADSSSLAD